MKNKGTKVSANRQKKIVLTEGLTAKVVKSKGIILTNYTGLTHHQLEGIKRAVKKLDAEFVITKNTLLKRALGENVANDDAFNQPTATLFAYDDIVEPLKVLAKSIKEVNMPIIKSGLVDNIWLNEKDVTRLATLPAKKVLQAQLLGMMKSPIQNLHRSLNWNIQKFVMTLHAIEMKKSIIN